MISMLASAIAHETGCAPQVMPPPKVSSRPPTKASATFCDAIAAEIGA